MKNNAIDDGLGHVVCRFTTVYGEGGGTNKTI